MMNRMNQLSAVSPHELKSMQEDLSFKETEMQKSQSTAKGLSSGQTDTHTTHILHIYACSITTINSNFPPDSFFPPLEANNIENMLIMLQSADT